MFLVFFKKYKRESELFIVALAVQLIIFFLTRSYGEGGFLWSSDAEGYFKIAQNFINYHGFYLEREFGPQSLRTPIYPLFVALWYWLVPKLEFTILLQNILGALAIVLIYRFGKKFLGERAATLGAFLFIFESQRLQNTNQLMSETLFFLFFIPALSFLLDNFDKKPSWRASLTSGVLLGLATLIRPTPYLLIFALPPAIIILGIIRKNFKQYLFCAGIFFVSAFIIVLPWLVRQKLLFGKFTIASGLASYTYNINAMRFLEYKGVPEPNKFVTEKAITELGYTGRTPETIMQDWLNNGLFEFKYSDYLYREGIKIISQDPLFFAQKYASRMITFFLDSSASRSYHAVLTGLNLPDKIFYPTLYWGGRFLWLFIWAIILLGLLIHRRVSNVWFYLLTFGLALYFSASLAMNSDAPRMRLAITPLILLLFTDQLLQFKKRFYAK